MVAVSAWLADVTERALALAATDNTILVTWNVNATSLTRREPWRSRMEEDFGCPSSSCPVLNLCCSEAIASRYSMHIYQGKVRALSKLVEALAVRAPATDIVFIDGRDVSWAGCGPAPMRHPLRGLRRALAQLRAASNASIFFGAELNPMECVGPNGCAVPRVPEWAMAACPRRLPVPCVESQLKRSARSMATKAADGTRRCDPQFLNSGTYAGSAAALAPMLRWVQSNFGYHGVRSDQGVFCAWWLMHQGAVALDYCALLASNLNAVAPSAYSRADADGRVVRYLGGETCLLHDNGDLGRCRKACVPSWRKGLERERSNE